MESNEIETVAQMTKSIRKFDLNCYKMLILSQIPSTII